MNSLILTKSQLNQLDPANLVVALWIGSNDILVEDGNEIMKDTNINNLNDAIEEFLKEVSGNSFEIMVIRDNKPFKVTLK